MLPKSDFSILHFFQSLPSFCVAVSKLKGEIKSCQRLVSKYEISWRKEKCQIFAFFPLAKSVWPHIGCTAQYEFEKKLCFPSFKSCHALHTGFGKSFWKCVCSQAKETKKWEQLLHMFWIRRIAMPAPITMGNSFGITFTQLPNALSPNLGWNFCHVHVDVHCVCGHRGT